MDIVKYGKKKDLNGLIASFKQAYDPTIYAALFIDMIAFIRPLKGEVPSYRMKLILDAIEEDLVFDKAIERVIAYLLEHLDVQAIFTELGVQNSGTFFSELSDMIRHWILPTAPDKNGLLYLLERAFYKTSDYKWVAAIPNEYWSKLFKHVAGSIDVEGRGIKRNLNSALTILAVRTAYLGLEDELSKRVHLDPDVDSPFLRLNRAIQVFVHLVKQPETKDVLLIASSEKILVILEQCVELIKEIKLKTKEFGASLEQTYLLLRTEQQLLRIRVIVRFLTPQQLPMKAIANTVIIFQQAIESINKRYSVLNLYRENSAMVSYQIAEHKSTSGEQYITTTRNEYTRFFYAAAAGGFIICFAALIKALLHKLNMAPFWQYFFYSINYAAAFVLLFITGASLATKQPTMTASALAGSLDSKKNGEINFENFSLTFAKVWRSQFAAFAGNLIIVFPLSYIFAHIWGLTTDTLLLDTKAYAQQNLDAQNPLKSLAFVYACITGVFLFISGLISGFFDNKVIYGEFGTRIKEHPYLNRVMKKEKLQKFADYIHNNLGGIIGNISLGFMLGYAKMIGDIFGIPFDIRHITISTAYFGYGVENLDNQLSQSDWIWTTIGVLGIGFLNFLVSFALAFTVALRSRNVTSQSIPELLKMIFVYFVRYPFDFIYPPAVPRKIEQVFKGPPSKQNNPPTEQHESI